MSAAVEVPDAELLEVPTPEEIAATFNGAMQAAAQAGGRSLRELQVRLHLRTEIPLSKIKQSILLTEPEAKFLLEDLIRVVPLLEKGER